MQKQYNLRNRDVPITANKAQPKKNVSKAVEDKKEKSKVAEGKDDSPLDKKDIQIPSPPKEIEKSTSVFNLENEIAKIKISVPFNEILKVDKYRSKIVEMLNSQPGVADILNVQEDNPIICLGPRLEDEQNEEFPPFYISISIHDMTLHNAMLDSGASHNLMPKVIMERLGLEVTRPYKDLFSFDSKRVHCIGLIKDVVVGLTQIPAKTTVMDIVVADIPPKFGMLLSRSWAAKIKGTMQMDLTYATIPVFGEQRRLYRETRMAYMVSSKDKPQNFPIYSCDTGLGSAILFNESVGRESQDETCRKSVSRRNSKEMKETSMGWWSLYFDGSAGKEGAGAGIWITSPTEESKFLSYKLNFDCTNNMAEYESLILGLEALIKLKAKNIVVCGDSELVIKQVEGAYQTKDVRMRAYRN
jgi:hypothetical protein